MGTRASSSSPVRLATRSVHTQGGYALWAHGPPPAPQSGSPHALYTAGRIRTVGTRASSSSPVRLATRSVHTQGGYALWAHGPPPAPQSGSPHALYTRREDTHCGHTGLLQLPSQARHTLCTHAGRIRTVGTRASSSSPVRLATRSVSSLQCALQDTHCAPQHTALPPPGGPCAHSAPQSGSPHALAGRIRTVGTRASCSPVRLATRSVHTQGGYACGHTGPSSSPVLASLRVRVCRACGEPDWGAGGGAGGSEAQQGRGADIQHQAERPRTLLQGEGATDAEVSQCPCTRCMSALGVWWSCVYPLYVGCMLVCVYSR